MLTDLSGGNPSPEYPPADRISRVPSDPGVYLMKGAGGDVIYVGKARNLKKRLSTYFLPSSKPDVKTAALIIQIRDFEVVITATENEALILESNLIKRYRPRYNVFLKDDKRYPSLRLDLQEPFPALEIVRKIRNDGAFYFGPFSSAKAMRETLRIIHKTFKLRKCRSRAFKMRSRPCLNHQMGLCLGPCSGLTDEECYKKLAKEVVLFLRGRTPKLISQIRKEMGSAAEIEDYENAAVLRDKVFSLEHTLEKQVSVMTDFKDRDVFSIVGGSEAAVVTQLGVRGGFLLGTRHFEFSEILSTDAEALGAFIRQYYDKGYFIPDEVLISLEVEDADFISEWLTQKKGKRVKMICPKRGEKARLTKMASQNAGTRLEEMAARRASNTDLLLRLQKRLRISRTPFRIECLDNSTLGGSESVASLVAFENGSPNPSGYRKYRIQNVNGPDDYAFMADVLNRRYSRNSNRGFPDLLMVDGGKGQLNVALSAIRELGLFGTFDIISIAKRDASSGETEDKIYLPGKTDPVRFGKERDLLLFLQRIRDEAHRSAVGFHRKRRRASALGSSLDPVPGIGRKRKIALLKHFGTIDGIRRAGIDEMAGLSFMTRKTAQLVKEHLQKGDATPPDAGIPD
ncbi:MAG: excinuclease ABC subunit UvrC [Pseudomonadota bacterium]